MAKNSRMKKVAAARPKAAARAIERRANVVTSANDNFADAFSDLVPEEFKDSDRYLNVVQWNLEWFGAQKSVALDRQRRDIVLDVLRALNADLFVFQEVAGPSFDGRYTGALDDLAEELTNMGAGDYVVFYTVAGGEQRVAMMYDREWLRAKGDVKELFEKGDHQPKGEKDPFAGRTPLYGYFTGRVPLQAAAAPAPDYFDFQVLGVHLKAMADGAPQRLRSAEILADWITVTAPLVDADAMIVGDWNAPPDDAASWQPFHSLENQNRVHFRDINDPSDYSYLWLANGGTKIGSRIDLTAMSLSSMKQVVGKPARVVRWKPIEEAMAAAGTMTDKRVREVMQTIKDNLSDHLPTATRFYFKPGE